jgi:hypothetical protein
MIDHATSLSSRGFDGRDLTAFSLLIQMNASLHSYRLIQSSEVDIRQPVILHQTRAISHCLFLWLQQLNCTPQSLSPLVQQLPS